MKAQFGHVLVSAGFRPLAKGSQALAYAEEARAIRNADSGNCYSVMTLPIETSTDGQSEFGVLARAIQLNRFSLRGIVMNPTTEELLSAFAIGQRLGFLDYMCLCQPWRPAAGDDSRSPETVFQDRVNVFTNALQHATQVKRVHLEFLIEPEAQHFNTLPLAIKLSDEVNKRCNRDVTRVVVDLAHLLGGHPTSEHDRLLTEYEQAVAAGKVEYIHLSDPLTRNHLLRAVQSRRISLERFLAPVKSGKVLFVDTEAFNPDDQDLGPLRERIPQFRGEGGKGWPNPAQMRDWWPSRHTEFVAWVKESQRILST